MCGRFALVANAQQIAEEFGVAPETIGPLEPRYNIAPTQPVLAVRERADGAREATHFVWGLVPSWARDISIGSRMINARAESAADKPAFRAAFRRRRCIVPASAFYEWARAGDTKQPYALRAADGRLMGLAGLWEVWNGPNGEELETCAIVTIAANGFMRRIHDRMPAILAREHYGAWLDRRLQEVPALQALLAPPPESFLEAWRVASIVNDPRNEVPDCLRPVE
jgi:putative SOS response-associated peptidase YedK